MLHDLVVGLFSIVLFLVGTLAWRIWRHLRMGVRGMKATSVGAVVPPALAKAYIDSLHKAAGVEPPPELGEAG